MKTSGFGPPFELPDASDPDYLAVRAHPDPDLPYLSLTAERREPSLAA
jgi:hypothetical protein